MKKFISLMLVFLVSSSLVFAADTIRSRSDILTLFADNTSGSITPQDLRDSVVSEAVHGVMYISNNTATTQSLTASTPVVINWLSESVYNGVTLDATTNDRITVSTAGKYLIACQVSMTSSSAATFEYHARVNGAASWPGFHRKVPINDVGSGMFLGVLDLSANDYVDIEVESDTNTTLTVRDGQFVLYRFY